MTRRYVHRERVRFGDLDANAHLNNVVYLRYFETARIAYMREMVPTHAPGARDRPQSGVIFAECHIRYRSPVHFDEEVIITCWIGEVRRSAFQMCFDMKVGERPVAEGYGWLVGFDYTQQKAARLSDALREKLEANLKPGANGGG
jgi:acyl-CoA thioester hydrolase